MCHLLSLFFVRESQEIISLDDDETLASGSDKKHQKSLVQKFFTITKSGNRVKCKLCGSYFSYKNKNTSHFLRHLKKAHKKQHDDEKAAQDANQPKIGAALKSQEIYPPKHPTRIHYNNRLVFHLAKDLQPANVVERPGFKVLIAGFDPRYTLPCRKTIRNVLIPQVMSPKPI